MHTTWLLSLLVLCGIFTLAKGSSGDRSYGFQRCLGQRTAQQCHTGAFEKSAPLSLRLTLWTCEDDCKYQCSHFMTDKAIEQQTRIEQYYGKWAFWRFLGMQEPASVGFSLLNLWAHIRGGIILQKQIRKGHPMRLYYLGFTVSNLNLWTWSAIFHTRDTPLTEKLDYFSAAFAMLCGLFYSVVRLYHLYDRPGTSPRNAWLIPWASTCILLFMAHVTYLTLLPRFDYGWNMKVNIAIGLAYNLLWISYSLPFPPYRRFLTRPNSYRPSFVWNPCFLGLSMIGAVCLEIFDFPPWKRIIDAHSLWHLATAPIVGFWYRFLLQDALDASWNEQKKGE